jgi:hypothetical protein
MPTNIGPVVATTPITLENFDDVGNVVVLSDFITSSGGVPDFALLTNHSTTLPGGAGVFSLAAITATPDGWFTVLMPGESILQPINVEEFDDSSMPYLVGASFVGNVNISCVGVSTGAQK